MPFSWRFLVHQDGWWGSPFQNFLCTQSLDLNILMSFPYKVSLLEWFAVWKARGKLWVHLHGFLKFASPRHSKTIAAMIQKSLKERHLQLFFESFAVPSCGSEDIELPKIKWFTATLQDYFLRPEVRRGAQSAEEALQLFKSIEEMRMVTVGEMISWTYVGVVFPNPTDTKVQSTKIDWHELS